MSLGIFSDTEEAVKRLCLALDNPGTLANAAKIMVSLSGRVGRVKFNSGFVAHHAAIVKIATGLGYNVWVDLKSLDIPETVKSTVAELRALGVQYVTIHLQGGSKMIEAAVESAGDEVKVLGITVLTSISQEMFTNELRIGGTIENHVLHLANLGKNHGVHGVVCSPLEVKAVRKASGTDFLLVTPGIRFAETDQQDQERVATPGNAIRWGSSLLVMGRPLIQDGAAAAGRALAEIEAALAELGQTA